VARAALHRGAGVAPGPVATPSCSSTTRLPTSRCCSRRRPSTRWWCRCP
jgi:hypothetical protein